MTEKSDRKTEKQQVKRKKWVQSKTEKREEQSRLAGQKKQEMKNLNRELKNLDEGEPIEKFRDKKRRVVYFDEEGQQYFTDEDGKAD